MASRCTEVLVYIASYIASWAGLERPYEESVGLGSYTDKKAVFWSKNYVSTRANFMVGRLIKKIENWRFCLGSDTGRNLVQPSRNQHEVVTCL